ncbi:hypothetical protein OROHE_008147 [Orobanche hederae]
MEELSLKDLQEGTKYWDLLLYFHLSGVDISMSFRNQGSSVGSSSRAERSCSGDGSCDWDDILEVCDFYEIAPGQLVPNAWRLLMGLEVFCEMREIPIIIEEVRMAYALKPTNADKGRFQLSDVSLGWRLLGKMADCCKSWRGKYFFMPFSVLRLPPNSEVPRIWNHVRRLGHPIDMLRESTKEWIEHFLSLDEEDRKVENILT